MVKIRGKIDLRKKNAVAWAKGFVISGITLLTVDPFICINGTLPSLLVIFSIVY